MSMVIKSRIADIFAEHMPGLPRAELVEFVLMVHFVQGFPRMRGETDEDWNDESILGLKRRAERVVSSLKEVGLLEEATP